MSPRVARIFRWSLAVAGTLLVAGLIVAGYAAWSIGHEPDWYLPGEGTPAEREAAADSALNKLIQAAEYGRLAMQQRRAGQSVPEAEMSLSSLELNSLMSRWEEFIGSRVAGLKDMEQPAVAFRDGRLILAVKVKSLGRTVVSVHFECVQRADGVALRLADVRGGTLALPDSLWSEVRGRLRESLSARAADSAGKAGLTQAGSFNAEAEQAYWARFFGDLLEGREVPLIIVAPTPTGGERVLLRVTRSVMVNGSTTMRLRVLSPDEAAALVRGLK